MDLRVEGQPSKKGTDLGQRTGLKLGMDLRVEGQTPAKRDNSREKGQTSAKS